jgi:hypothetical protein
MVYVRRVIAVVCGLLAVDFALRIPHNLHRTDGKGPSHLRADIMLVVLFVGIAAALLIPTRERPAAPPPPAPKA